MDYKFHAPPTVATLPSGKFIIGMKPIVTYTPEKLKEVEQAYAESVEQHRKLEQSMKPKVVEVASKSDPNKKYKVQIHSDGKIECNCRGYQFRRSCSHIDQVKKGG